MSTRGIKNQAKESPEGTKGCSRGCQPVGSRTQAKESPEATFWGIIWFHGLTPMATTCRHVRGYEHSWRCTFWIRTFVAVNIRGVARSGFDDKLNKRAPKNQAAFSFAGASSGIASSGDDSSAAFFSSAAAFFSAAALSAASFNAFLTAFLTAASTARSTCFFS